MSGVRSGWTTWGAQTPQISTMVKKRPERKSDNFLRRLYGAPVMTWSKKHLFLVPRNTVVSYWVGVETCQQGVAKGFKYRTRSDLAVEGAQRKRFSLPCREQHGDTQHFSVSKHPLLWIFTLFNGSLPGSFNVGAIYCAHVALRVCSVV